MNRRSLFAAIGGAMVSPLAIAFGGGIPESEMTKHMRTKEYWMSYLQARDSPVQQRAHFTKYGEWLARPDDPTCDLTRDHCRARFDNLLNYGGFV